MEDADRRGSDSIILIGLLFGPFTLMLWLGRGRLAFLYLLLQSTVAVLIIVVAAMGLVAPPAWEFGLFAIALNLPIHIVGIFHAFRIRDASLRRPWFSRWHSAIVLPLAISWIVAFVVRESLYQSFNAPSLSMVPSIMIGDYFLVSKTDYGYSHLSFSVPFAKFPGRIWAGEPRRGDIVVFKLPRDNETDYIKRLVGIPGDRIQMRDGIVHLNGEALPLTRVQDIPCIEGERCNFFRETLPDGRSYVINNATPNGPADNTEEYIVPEGHYFMLGDNRDNSLDSRFGEPNGIGYIPYENLVGPVTLIFWNSMGLRIDDRLAGYPSR